MSCNCLDAASYIAASAHALLLGEFVNKELENAEILWQSADDFHLSSLFLCALYVSADS